ncbi:hypothetical protein RTCIAT899_PC09460 (plasmid) [Rhizobium tropici CIAT 899]|nr:hypothetical protein RTCIAT899_PC09460 [Rhizobium tropici CIAT 899]
MPAAPEPDCCAMAAVAMPIERAHTAIILVNIGISSFGFAAFKLGNRTIVSGFLDFSSVGSGSGVPTRMPETSRRTDRAIVGIERFRFLPVVLFR